ncbi:MAG: thrombospondin type 3 repeat-containing protein, partial [Gammaproteobacteria bacterium]|nr:thrombospondin type 3 repeat-containing protein [Gammaproteobacteria bacterium]
DGWHVDDIRVRGAGAQCLTGVDSDADGVLDAADNCVDVANSDQRDTNGDGIGNICDPDLDNNGVVNFSDVAILKGNFLLPGDLDTDFDGNGQTNFVDLGILQSFFLGPPGPAAGQ